MRAHLLATTATVALPAATSAHALRVCVLVAVSLAFATAAHAQNATWFLTPSIAGPIPGTFDYNAPANWNSGAGPPGLGGTGYFGTTNGPNISFSANTSVGGWTFTPGVQPYTFTIPTTLAFSGAGIVTNGVSVTINNNGSTGLFFVNSASAGSAAINNNSLLQFNTSATAGSATINNAGIVNFTNNSTAGSATINNAGLLFFTNNGTGGTATIATNGGGTTTFFNSSTGGAARFITNSGGTVDISRLVTTGTTAGSIEGAGNYFLGSKELTTGLNNLSTEVSGVIADGGAGGGTGGSLVKVGTGTLTLSGVNTYTGPTTVNAGTLVVKGSIAPSSLTTVNSGGTLGGTGTVGNTQINSGGIFAPGSGIAGSSMTVAGNLAFQSGALYLVQVNSSTASLANVTGTASLAGTVDARLTSGAFTTIKTYDILHSSGLGGTTFNGLIISNPNLGASLTYTGTDVFLTLKPALGGGANLNENQQNVANALNNFVNGGGTLPPGFASLFGLTGGTLANALSQLDGEVATGAERAALQLTNSFLTLLTDPIGCGGANASALLAISPSACERGRSALPFAPEQEASLPPDIALAYASIFKAPPKPTFEQHWSTWGSAYGGSNTSNGVATVGSNNVTTDIFGFAAGMDYSFTPDLLAGFALAGAGTNWGLANGLGTGGSDAFQVGARVISWFGPAYVKGALAFTNNWFTTNRSALGDQLTANFDGQSYGGRLEGGYRYFVLPALGVTPYGALQAQDFHTPAYSETDVNGIGFGLTHPAMNATDVRSELGARFDDPTLLYGKALILFGRLAWAHDFVNNPALSAGFQTLPGASFTVNGAPIPHDSALTTAGAELFFSANWSLLAKFEGEFGNGSQTYAGTGTLRFTW